MNVPYHFALMLICLVISSAVISCGDDQPRDTGDSGVTDEVYEARGRYLSTDLRGESISVIHETIPDVMNAMRMSLRIDDASVAETLQPGDLIRFDMVRTGAGWYARNIELLPPETELNLPDHLREVGLPQ